MGFSSKVSACDPWVTKIPWRRAWQPTAVFLPEESQGQGCLTGCSPWGHKESDMTATSTHSLSTELVIAVGHWGPILPAPLRNRVEYTREWSAQGTVGETTGRNQCFWILLHDLNSLTLPGSICRLWESLCGIGDNPESESERLWLCLREDTENESELT